MAKIAPLGIFPSFTECSSLFISRVHGPQPMAQNITMYFLFSSGNVTFPVPPTEFIMVYSFGSSFFPSVFKLLEIVGACLNIKKITIPRKKNY
jgi:hypothetical protein